MKVELEQLTNRRKQLEKIVEEAHAALHNAMGRLDEMIELEQFASVVVPSSGSTFMQQKVDEVAMLKEELARLNKRPDEATIESAPVEAMPA
jgi:hypothetical protein